MPLLKVHKGTKKELTKPMAVIKINWDLFYIVPLRHFRKPFHIPLELSSVGMGTYIGAPDDQIDFDVYNAVKLMVQSGGINVLDTAINYRC